MNESEGGPFIYKYLKKYQEDPSSRIFAPLAEAYRKAGLVDEAIEIAREGLRVHPQFVSGKVALARALFDKKLYQEVIDLLSPIIQDSPDNLLAGKLLGDSYLVLGKTLESLNAYKMLFYFCPNDTELAQVVFELETRVYEKGDMLLRTDLHEFQVKSAEVAIHEDPELIKAKKIQQIEKLQSLFKKIERYRYRFKLDH